MNLHPRMANTNALSELQFVTTVTTGLEKIALDEVKEAGFQAIGFRDGFIFFQTSDLALPKVRNFNWLFTLPPSNYSKFIF